MFRTGKKFLFFASHINYMRRIKKTAVLFSKMYLLKNTMKVSVQMEWAEIYRVCGASVMLLHVERGDAMVSCTKVA